MLLSPRFVFALALVTVPFAVGAKGDGCAAASKSEAPDVTGDWAIEYESKVGVEIRIGGAVYTSELGPEGGTVTIDHEGQPISFDLDCSRPEVVCPAEAWPDSVSIDQKNDTYEHQMIVTLPKQTCSGALVEPDPSSCGDGTTNPDCKKVCDGDITVSSADAFGVIGEPGDSFRLYLGAEAASNGVNCALLGWSYADADLVTEDEGTDTWRAIAMESGTVTVAYAGGCLWVANVDADPALEAAVLGASVTFTVPFTGERK
jgi:hypothetical protein